MSKVSLCLERTFFKALSNNNSLNKRHFSTAKKQFSTAVAQSQIKSQEPQIKSQKPQIKSQEPQIKSQKPQIKTLFSPKLSPQESKLAIENVHRSVRGNPVEIRKTYWFNVYMNIIKESKSMFVVQNNNMPAHKYNALKIELRSKGLECLAIRNGIFSAACNKNGLQGMNNLFQGPTLVWFTPATDEQAPNMIKDVASLVQKYKSNLLFVGGNLDSFIFSADQFEDIKKLPSKVALLGQLLGLIQYPATAITQILSQTPHMLAANLEQHAKQISEKE